MTRSRDGHILNDRTERDRPKARSAWRIENDLQLMVASFGEKKLRRRLRERRKGSAQAARSTSRKRDQYEACDRRLCAVETEPEPLACWQCCCVADGDSAGGAEPGGAKLREAAEKLRAGWVEKASGREIGDRPTAQVGMRCEAKADQGTRQMQEGRWRLAAIGLDEG